MANDFTILPNQGYVNQSANTAIIPQNNEVLDNYWRAAENQYRNKVLAYQKHKDEVDARLKEIDFDTSGTWERDLKPISDKTTKEINVIKEHPDWISPNADNMEGYLTHKQGFDNLKYLVTQSKYDKSQYDAWKTKIVTDTELSKNAKDYLSQLDQWASKPVGERGDFLLIPVPDNNIFVLAKKLESAIDIGTSAETVSSKDRLGQIKNTTTTTQNLDLGKLPLAAEVVYKTDPSWRAFADEEYAKLSPEKKAQHQPSDMLIEGAIPFINAKQTAKDAFRIDWQSQYSAKQDVKGIDWIAQNAFKLGDPTSNIWSPMADITKVTTYRNGQPVSTKLNTTNGNGVVTHAFDEIKLPIGEGDNRTYSAITGLFKIDGKLYARPFGYQEEGGAINKDKLIPINDIKQQLIIPYVNLQYGSSPNTAGLIDETLKLYDSYFNTNNEQKNGVKGMGDNAPKAQDLRKKYNY